MHTASGPWTIRRKYLNGARDITGNNNNEFGFDYLRANNEVRSLGDGKRGPLLMQSFPHEGVDSSSDEKRERQLDHLGVPRLDRKVILAK